MASHLRKMEMIKLRPRGKHKDASADVPVVTIVHSGGATNQLPGVQGW
jgi:hypothetical protein